MLTQLHKLFLAGLGTIELTEAKLKAICDDLVAGGEVTEREAQELVRRWSERAAEQRDKIKQQIDETVERALAKLRVSRMADVEKLESRVADLERRMRHAEDAG
jgi:polyhydroxyalkanoate synthesis regulator phasin